MRKRIIAGNWKMNKTPQEALELAKLFKNAGSEKADVVLCVPSIDLVTVYSELEGTEIHLGAQNMFYEESGAYTGEISPLMLKAAGVEYVILGHSERRTIFGETDEVINKKIKKALEYGIIPIVCVGESLNEREAGITEERLRIQTKAAFSGVSAADAAKVIVAYEPIWAIGTGKTASAAEADEGCKAVRKTVEALYGAKVSDEIRIQYGGSVNGKNAAELLKMENIDGGLIGGASLKEEFLNIINA